MQVISIIRYVRLISIIVLIGSAVIISYDFISFSFPPLPTPKIEIYSTVPQNRKIKHTEMKEYLCIVKNIERFSSNTTSQIKKRIFKQNNKKRKFIPNNYSSNKLKLKGIIYSNRLSAAFIESNSKQGVYFVGDKILEYTLTKIFPYKVILKSSKDTLVLTMKNISRASVYKEDNVIQTGKDKYILPREKVEDIKRNPAEILQNVGFVPNVVGGLWCGVKISYIKPGSFFHNKGLYVGDVIKKINGVQITSIDDAFKLYQKLAGAKKFIFEIEREGKKRKIIYEVK